MMGNLTPESEGLGEGFGSGEALPTREQALKAIGWAEAQGVDVNGLREILAEPGVAEADAIARVGKVLYDRVREWGMEAVTSPDALGVNGAGRVAGYGEFDTAAADAWVALRSFDAMGDGATEAYAKVMEQIVASPEGLKALQDTRDAEVKVSMEALGYARKTLIPASTATIKSILTLLGREKVSRADMEALVNIVTDLVTEVSARSSVMVRTSASDCASAAIVYAMEVAGLIKDR